MRYSKETIMNILSMKNLTVEEKEEIESIISDFAKNNLLEYRYSIKFKETSKINDVLIKLVNYQITKENKNNNIFIQKKVYVITGEKEIKSGEIIIKKGEIISKKNAEVNNIENRIILLVEKETRQENKFIDNVRIKAEYEIVIFDL